MILGEILITIYFAAWWLVFCLPMRKFHAIKLLVFIPASFCSVGIPIMVAEFRRPSMTMFMILWFAVPVLLATAMLIRNKITPEKWGKFCRYETLTHSGQQKFNVIVNEEKLLYHQIICITQFVTRQSFLVEGHAPSWPYRRTRQSASLQKGHLPEKLTHYTILWFVQKYTVKRTLKR